MTFQRLKWLGILAPLLLFLLVQVGVRVLLRETERMHAHLLLDGTVVVIATLLYVAIFLAIGRRIYVLERENRELAALRAAGLDIVSELSLEVVLQKVVDQARALIETRYGALAVYDESGAIQSFVTSGIDSSVRQKIAGLPVGKGLLGVVMKHGQSIRTNDISADPRSRGLPEHHPPLSSLLAVPVICRGPFRGNLYLSERIDGKSFTKIDEETLIRFASQTAIAVDNAHLHARVRSLAVVEERLRLSREMHDGQAQVLAYVNTKAQAVGELLRAGRLEEARDHLSQLAAAAREIYTDVREGIFGLRRIVDHERGLAEAIRDHVEQWQEQSKIPVTLELDDLPRFSTDVELQLLRILQESLANVRKHSGATRARVEVCYEDGGAKIEVEDDGEGFDPANPKRQRRPRFGLATMRERAEAIDASLMLDSRPGSGTRVQLVYRPRLEEAS